MSIKKATFLLIFGFFSWSSAQDFSTAHLPKSMTDNAYAVVRMEKIKTNFHQPDKVNYTIETAITILNESGLKFAYNPVAYTKSDRISKYNAVLYDANGKEIRKLKSKDLKDVSSYDGFSLFTDRRVQYYEFTPTSYPFTIYYYLEVNSSNTISLPSWVPISDYHLAVESSQYELNNLSGIPIRQNETQLANWPIQKSENGNQAHYAIQNIAALEDEVMSPSLNELTPQIRFAPTQFQLEGVKGQFSNWQEFGQWMYEHLLKDKQDLSQKDKEIALQLVEGVDDPKEKVKILYQFMQSKTRYVNISIGIGGWEPFPASYVSSKSYGDCKALSNYMVSLIKLIGLDAYYTIVHADQSKRVNLKEDFASLQGNHVIVNVPLEDETLWLECTSQQTAFNYLGNFTNDRFALSVGPEGGKIISTQKFPADSNREVIQSKLELLPNGNLKGNSTISHSGLQYDFAYRLYFLNESDQKKYLGQLLGDSPNNKLKEYRFDNNRDEAHFKTELEFEFNQFGQLIGDDMLVHVLPFGRSKTNLKKDNQRKFPFEVDYGYLDQSEFEMKLPQNYKLSEEMSPILYIDQFGYYSLTVEQKDQNTLLIKRKLKLNDGSYTKDQFNDFVEFRRKVSSFDNSKILLQKI